MSSLGKDGKRCCTVDNLGFKGVGGGRTGGDTKECLPPDSAVEAVGGRAAGRWDRFTPRVQRPPEDERPERRGAGTQKQGRVKDHERDGHREMEASDPEKEKHRNPEGW